MLIYIHTKDGPLSKLYSTVPHSIKDGEARVAQRVR